jgi:hypothetical protein
MQENLRKTTFNQLKLTQYHQTSQKLPKMLQKLPHEANQLGFGLVIEFIGDQTQNFKTPSYFQFEKMSLLIYFIRCALVLLHESGHSIISSTNGISISAA